MAGLTPSDATKTGQQESFFNNQCLSDVTITFGSESLHAHKIILAKGSTYFKKMFCGSFKEANSNEVKLCEDDPLAIHAMIRFLYGLDYQSAGTKSDWLRLSPHAHLYAAAEKYDLPSLKSTITDVVKSEFKSLDSDLYHLNDFCSALSIVWRGTPSSDNKLRQLLTDRCSKNLDSLLKHATFLRVLRDTELGADLCIRTAKDLASLSGKGPVRVGTYKAAWGYNALQKG
ncbi:hypothetical protein Q7P37_006657 [Cladosporium fusiforme]